MITPIHFIISDPTIRVDLVDDGSQRAPGNLCDRASVGVKKESGST